MNDRKRFVGIGHDYIIQGTVPENQDGYVTICMVTDQFKDGNPVIPAKMQ